MLITTKLKLTYITIGTYFFFGGIEYAVILPTLWLYISTVFNAPPYLLGIILSSFSVSDLLSGMLLGRISDKTHQTKLLLILTNVFQAVGSFLYIIDIGPEMLVISRLVTGFGSGITAPLIGDLARVIPDSERTSTLSIFFALRQVGLVLGPACNLFLNKFDFYFASYHVNKYTSPGFFMMILWILHELMSVFMFWNLPSLHLNYQAPSSSPPSLLPPYPSSLSSSSSESSSRYNDSMIENNEDVSGYEKVDEMGSNNAHDSSFDDSNATNCERMKINTKQFLLPKSNKPVNIRPDLKLQLQVDQLSCGSNDYMENAEALIRFNTSEKCQRDLNPTRSKMDVLLSDDERMEEGGDDSDVIRSSRDVVGNLTDVKTVSKELKNYNDRISINVNSNDAEDSESHDDDIVKDHGKDHTNDSHTDVVVAIDSLPASPFRELFKSHLIAILMSVFIGFFNQMALEALLTPLTKTFLSWGELENSYLYCAAGIEIILVFILIRPISRKVEDKWLILIGLILQLISIGMLMGYLPWANRERRELNLILFVVVIFINLIGLPMLFVCSNSLYTRLVPSQIQGFSQGIRKVFGGIGTILGPLWAGGIIDDPFALFGVMFAACLVALILFLSSFKDLTPSIHRVPPSVHPSSSSTQSVDENTPLLGV